MKIDTSKVTTKEARTKKIALLVHHSGQVYVDSESWKDVFSMRIATYGALLIVFQEPDGTLWIGKDRLDTSRLGDIIDHKRMFELAGEFVKAAHEGKGRVPPFPEE